MLQHMIHVGRVAAADGGVGRRARGCNIPSVFIFGRVQQRMVQTLFEVRAHAQVLQYQY